MANLAYYLNAHKREQTGQAEQATEDDLATVGVRLNAFMVGVGKLLCALKFTEADLVLLEDFATGTEQRGDQFDQEEWQDLLDVDAYQRVQKRTQLVRDAQALIDRENEIEAKKQK